MRALGSTRPSILQGQNLKEYLMSKEKQKQPIVLAEIIIGKSKLKVRQSVATTTSKQQTLIALLKRRKGASLEELMGSPSWQHRSMVSTLSGVLKKR